MALLTAVYVAATMLIVLESRRTNRIQRRSLEQAEELERSRRRPYVVFSIDFEREVRSRHDTLIYVYASIENVGATSAHKITVRTVPTLQGRLGIDAEQRTPAIVNSEIAFLPPGQKKRDLVSLSEFLFEDHADEALRYVVVVQYTDIAGTTYHEEYEIDLAGQKEALEAADSHATLQHQALEYLGRLTGSLSEIARTLDAPDRSQFMVPLGGGSPVSAAQRELLSALVAASKEQRNSSRRKASVMSSLGSGIFMGRAWTLLPPLTTLNTCAAVVRCMATTSTACCSSQSLRRPVSYCSPPDLLA